jgi:hypothetical protein
MQPLVNPELIEEFQKTFPGVVVTNLTKLFDNDEFLCYKDTITDINYLYDAKLKMWIKESTEYWRNVPIT